MKRFLASTFKTDISKDQSRDTGMAIVLICLLLWVFLKRDALVITAMVVHVINMIAPQVFRIPAILWFGFAHCLGTVVSKLLLTIIYLVVVTPTRLVRSLAGKDSLRLKSFKAKESVLRERVHTFSGADLEKPY